MDTRKEELLGTALGEVTPVDGRADCAAAVWPRKVRTPQSIPNIKRAKAEINVVMLGGSKG